jgi:hypothetical protein
MKAVMFQKLAPATATKTVRAEIRRLPEFTGSVKVAAWTPGLE